MAPLDPAAPMNYPDYPPAYSPQPPPAPPYGYPPPYPPDAAGYGGPPGYGNPMPYGGAPGYPGPYDPYQLRRHETNGLAIGSLVTSIAGVVLGVPLTFFCYIGVLIPIVGVVLGAVALSQIKRTHQRGRGLAIAGITVGAVMGVVLLLLAVVIMAAVFNRLSTT